MLTAYVRKIGSDRANPILSMIFDLRTHVHKAILRLFPEPEASLLSGILLGKESGIPPDLLEAYNRTGTTHIIAISGFKMLILDVLIGSELLTYRTEVLFLFVYRFLTESNGRDQRRAPQHPVERGLGSLSTHSFIIGQLSSNNKSIHQY